MTSIWASSPIPSKSSPSSAASIDARGSTAQRSIAHAASDCCLTAIVSGVQLGMAAARVPDAVCQWHSRRRRPLALSCVCPRIPCRSTRNYRESGQEPPIGIPASGWTPPPTSATASPPARPLIGQRPWLPQAPETGTIRHDCRPGDPRPARRPLDQQTSRATRGGIPNRNRRLKSRWSHSP